MTARPPGTLDRWLAVALGRLFAATLATLVLVYLVIDFADRGPSFKGDAWQQAAAEFYLNKSAVVAHQLAPAAFVVATALLVAQLQRRSELAALLSLGVSPLRLAVPVAGAAILLSALLVPFYEGVVLGADARAEEITVRRFHRWGDYGNWHAEWSWVRGREGRVFKLGKRTGGGFEPATVLELGADFRLARRLEAKRLEPAGDGRWRLAEVVERRYASAGAQGPAQGEAIVERRLPELLEPFPESPEELALRNGRPRQLPFGAIREQVVRRSRLGLPVREYEVALSERAGSPALLPLAALLVFALSLPGRRRSVRPRSLSGALALGLVVALGLWAVTVVLHAAAIGGSLAPWAVGALPPLCCFGGAAVALRSRSHPW